MNEDNEFVYNAVLYGRDDRDCMRPIDYESEIISEETISIGERVNLRLRGKDSSYVMNAFQVTSVIHTPAIRRNGSAQLAWMPPYLALRSSEHNTRELEAIVEEDKE